MPQPKDSAADLTTLLSAWQKGNESAFQGLFERAYAELKKIAQQRLRELGGNCSLAPTELLHETILKLLDAPVDWQNRAHFFASMSLYLRSVMVDHARARGADKRGGNALHITMTHIDAGEESGIADLLTLDTALKQLHELDPRSAEVLHLTYFAGLSREEIADVLKISLATVIRDLRFAKSWLNRHMDYGL